MLVMDQEEKWKILSSKYLFRRPWLTARVDTVELPDGRVNPEYYVLEYPSWVNVIAIDETGMFVMERQYRHALGVTEYELPCGVVEQGEEPLSAAKRELEEETGYTGGNWTLLTVVGANPGSLNNLTYCFLAEGVRKTAAQKLDDTEDLTVHMLSESDVFGLLERDELKQSLMTTPLWKYFYRKNVKRGSETGED